MADPTKEELLAAAKKLSEKKAALDEREMLLNEQKKQMDVLLQQKAQLEKEVADYEINRKKEIEDECSFFRKERMAAVQKEIDKEYADLENARLEKEKSNNKVVDDLSKILDTEKEKALAEKVRADSAESDLKAKQILVDGLEKKVGDLTKLNGDLQIKLNESFGIIEQNKDLHEQLSKKVTEINQFKNLQDLIGENSLETLIEQISDLHNREEKLKLDQKQLADDRDEYNFDKANLQNQKARFSEEELNKLIEERISTRYAKIIEEKDKRIAMLESYVEKLRNELCSKSQLAESYTDFKAMFNGRNPVEVIADNERITKELKEALDKVRSTPSELLKKEYADLKKDQDRLLSEQEELKQKADEYNKVLNEKAELIRDKDVIQKELESVIKHNNFLESENSRLKASYDDPTTREERIEAINKPYIRENLPRLAESNVNEVEWLKNIKKGIKDYNIQFADRLLLSFHTALKTAEMSPLTVLAGVSGTGKSLLPRLYSHFGGINFISVPVAPNWDCQEAMLGYYNSIDNCFDAQPVLRFLAQTQRERNNQNGLDDVMNLILLDEMNLANVELYFSEFLSKLETRRDYQDGDKNIPKLLVKIGSKMDDEPLELGRNVLWTGTMNQDETTKTLSDKVLDRGIILNFPTPLSLESRPGNSYLGPAASLIKRDNWKAWQNKDAGITEEDLKPYKTVIEEINKQLNTTGRALGHRVWQSIESYIRLHPEVIYSDSDAKKNAIKRAFEDQLVQKVMPKLRGLETRGLQGDALSEIERIIADYSIVEDFDKARNQGFGQFMWCSSDYIYKDPDSPILSETVTIEGQAQDSSKPDTSNIDSHYAEMAEKYKNDGNAYNNFKKRLINEGETQEKAKEIARMFFGK
ncbi:hypothetical protein [Treponema sp.]|uniref:hypothetical protein n=1 Tax=Treponema sp. TaxID=166 RepID=UPI003FD86384